MRAVISACSAPESNAFMSAIRIGLLALFLWLISAMQHSPLQPAIFRNNASRPIRMADMNAFDLGAEHAEITARIHDAGRDVALAQDGNGDVHGIAFGDASQIDPERAIETYPASGKQLNRPP